MLRPIETTLPAMLAEAQGPNFPLAYQVACVICTGLFLLAFSIARNPRGWRRFYQVRLARDEEMSVNKNKRLDELIKRYSVIVAMLFFAADAAAFVGGITYRARQRPQGNRSESERFHAIDVQKASEAARY